MFKKNYTYLLIALGVANTLSAHSQSINHWETAIHNTDQWQYFVGASEPPSNWMLRNFDASTWATGQGGFGYDDGDDNTTIASTTSVYIIRSIDLKDTSALQYAILHADYDDGFVAYLNGTEIARSNIGTVGTPPKYNDVATTYKEAQLYQGLQPEAYELGYSTIKTLLKEGDNTLAVQIHNNSPTSSDLSSNFFLSFGIKGSATHFSPTPSWFVAPNLGSTLPLFVITTDNGASIENDPKIDAHLGIIASGNINNLGDSYNGYDGKIGIEIRGASSQTFSKKSYSFETRLTDGSNNNVSLLGLPEENDWVLHGPYSDKTLLRNVLAYHMGSSTSNYTPRTRLCELYINNEYQGVYMLTEKIKRDKNRVDIAKLTSDETTGDDLTGGYIFQIDRDDPSTDIDGWETTSSPNKFVAYHDPKADELAPAQREYLKTYFTDFENDMQSAEYYWKYNTYVDVESWVNYFLVTEIGKHIDAYKLSFYMHKDKASKGGKINFGPLWDFNLGFGNFDFVCSPSPQGWTYEFQGTCDNSHPFWVKKLMQIPHIQNKIDCQWNTLRQGPLHTDTLMQYIDQKVAQMGDAPARNFEKWDVLGQYIWPNNYVGATYEEEVTYLKTWLTTRLTWMDNNMVGDCSLVGTNDLKENKVSFSIYPNPVIDNVFVEISSNDFRNTELIIYNCLGTEVFYKRLKSSVEKVNLSCLSSGIYIAKTYSNGIENGSLRVVKK